jgi:hypothetical protein
VASFQDTVDIAEHHALINQSRVLVNMLVNLIQQLAGGYLEQQSGPAYFLARSSAADKGKNPEEETALLGCCLQFLHHNSWRVGHHTPLCQTRGHGTVYIT